MTRYEDDRYRGRRPEADARGGDAAPREERARNDRDPNIGRSRGNGLERFERGGESQSAYSPEGRQTLREGERDVRDHSRGQHRNGGYDPYGPREYPQGGGYGGYGETPGEGAGGLGSGRHYSAEPGWGPGYGARGNERARWHAGEGSFQQGHDPRGPHPEPERLDPASGAASQLRDDERLGSYWGRAGRGPMPPGPRYGRGPTGYQRSDERLKEDICERLMWRGEHLDVSEVSIEVKDGHVVLEGAVPERRMKRALEDVVDECMGVKEIENRIRVTYAEHRHVHAARASQQVAASSSVGAGPGNASAVSGMSTSPGGRSGEASES